MASDDDNSKKKVRSKTKKNSVPLTVKPFSETPLISSEMPEDKDPKKDSKDSKEVLISDDDPVNAEHLKRRRKKVKPVTKNANNKKRSRDCGNQDRQKESAALGQPKKHRKKSVQKNSPANPDSLPSVPGSSEFVTTPDPATPATPISTSEKEEKKKVQIKGFTSETRAGSREVVKPDKIRVPAKDEKVVKKVEKDQKVVSKPKKNSKEQKAELKPEKKQKSKPDSNQQSDEEQKHNPKPKAELKAEKKQKSKPDSNQQSDEEQKPNPKPKADEEQKPSPKPKPDPNQKENRPESPKPPPRKKEHYLTDDDDPISDLRPEPPPKPVASKKPKKKLPQLITSIKPRMYPARPAVMDAANANPTDADVPSWVMDLKDLTPDLERPNASSAPDPGNSTPEDHTPGNSTPVTPTTSSPATPTTPTTPTGSTPSNTDPSDGKTPPDNK
ncbi:unnamed protein product [Bursaphelenchus okinawaensis]|uniref:Uncharacterized protein n=1 Tax=Bursaphelenchus okinawaensis TaxID=465554 RepID=A0A811KT24_9BILA|nr:unnamed protein product [Bursaphelenchus okinawaensis]CAG9110404.1 unnamed protein product [Bursaphelenchus okinawaensis]